MSYRQSVGLCPSVSVIEAQIQRLTPITVVSMEAITELSVPCTFRRATAISRELSAPFNLHFIPLNFRWRDLRLHACVYLPGCQIYTSTTLFNYSRNPTDEIRSNPTPSKPTLGLKVDQHFHCRYGLSQSSAVTEFGFGNGGVLAAMRMANAPDVHMACGSRCFI